MQKGGKYGGKKLGAPHALPLLLLLLVLPLPHYPGFGSPREHRKGVLCTQEGACTHTCT